MYFIYIVDFRLEPGHSHPGRGNQRAGRRFRVAHAERHRERVGRPDGADDRPSTEHDPECAENRRSRPGPDHRVRNLCPANVVRQRHVP